MAKQNSLNIMIQGTEEKDKLAKYQEMLKTTMERIEKMDH